MTKEEVEKLENRLDEFYEKFNKNVIEEEFKSRHQFTKPNINTTLLNSTANKLFRNYSYYNKNSNFANNEMCCRYLNYWLNEQKIRCISTSDNVDSNYFYDKIQYVCSDIYEYYGNTGKKCDINIKKYSEYVWKIRRKIDDLCYIKEQLGGSAKISKNRKICSSFNKYLYKTLKYIFNEITSTNRETLEPNDFKIEGACSENNLGDILTEVECANDSESDNVPKECKPQQEASLTADHEAHTIYKECKKIDCDENECTCRSFHIVLTMFLTVLGSFLLCVFLYTFTPFGSLLNKLKMRKSKIRHEVDEEQTQVLSEHTSDYDYKNPLNMQYLMPYNSLRE
ncbi:PIR Superfamily Protein [Plasmodium ovale curtisi]|uniref:PIR Superfamily Protein n=1 Tax=Plasmodium ovale curtisi TaxID=864141 RepID=A0A1A8WC66_PLAOA|nr:PIR Superfamily Protein [Plasmodium ovale curtisi]